MSFSNTLSLAMQLVELYVRTISIEHWRQLPLNVQQEIFDAFIGASFRMLGNFYSFVSYSVSKLCFVGFVLSSPSDNSACVESMDID